MKKALLATLVAVVSATIWGTVGLTAQQAAYAADEQKQVVYIYNWTEYIPSSLLTKFTKETGIEIRYSTYESNEELYSKLKLVNGEGYDLIFPSNYYIGLLKSEGMLQKIDHSKIHMDNILPDLLHRPYDVNNDYSLPYTYGFTAIAVDANKINPSQITSWSDLWDPKYKDIVLLNDVLDDFSMSLLSLGINPNQATDAQVEQGYKHLQDLSPKVLQFNSDSPEQPYMEGQASLGMIWSGSIFRAQHEGFPNLKIVYPKEGAILWIDNFAIPAKAKHVDAAYKFINFILEPENALEIVKQMGFQTSNSKVQALMPKDWQQNIALFPPKEVFDKATMNNIPATRLEFYNSYWNKLKVQ